jgi:hypothetical protein
VISGSVGAIYEWVDGLVVRVIDFRGEIGEAGAAAERLAQERADG